MSHIRISTVVDSSDGEAKLFLNRKVAILARDFCIAAGVPASPLNLERAFSFLSERLGFSVSYYFHSSFSVGENRSVPFRTHSRSELEKQLLYLSSLISDCLKDLVEFHDSNDDKILPEFAEGVFDVSPGFVLRHSIPEHSSLPENL